MGVGGSENRPLTDFPTVRRDELLKGEKGAPSCLRGGVELEKPGESRGQLDPGEPLHAR